MAIHFYLYLFSINSKNAKPVIATFAPFFFICFSQELHCFFLAVKRLTNV